VRLALIADCDSTVLTEVQFPIADFRLGAGLAGWVMDGWADCVSQNSRDDGFDFFDDYFCPRFIS
jgi:hypothetical protein